MTEASSLKLLPGRHIADSPTETPRHRWAITVAVTVATVALIHLITLVGNSGPILYNDALGYLGNARFLSGGPAPTFDGSPFYAAGYSLLLVPLYWVTSQPQAIWALATLVNVLMSIAIMGPAYWLGRQLFSLEKANALLGAIAVSLTPALLLQPGRAWVETLFPFVFLSATALALATARARSICCGLASGLLVGYLILVHGRAMPIAAAFAIFLAAGYFLLHFRLTLVMVSTMGVLLGFGTSVAIQSYLTEHLWNGSPDGNTNALSIVLTAFDPTHIVETAITGLGHVWYVVAVSFGISAVGIVSLGIIAYRAKSVASTRPQALVAAFVLLSTVGLLVLSAGFLSGGPRVDHRVYGRYLEGVSPLLVLAGVAVMVQKRWAWKAVLASGLSTAAIATALRVAGGSDYFSGNVQKLTIPGLIGPQTVVDRAGSIFLPHLDVIGISMLTAALGTGIALIVKVRPRLGVVAMIVVTVAITFVGKAASWDPFVSFWHESFNHIPTALQDSDRDRPISYDVRFLNGGARNLYEFRVAPDSLMFVDDPCQASPGDFVISSSGLRGPPRDVLELVTIDRVPKQALYIRDGSPIRSCR